MGPAGADETSAHDTPLETLSERLFHKPSTVVSMERREVTCNRKNHQEYSISSAGHSKCYTDIKTIFRIKCNSKTIDISNWNVPSLTMKLMMLMIEWAKWHLYSSLPPPECLMTQWVLSYPNKASFTSSNDWVTGVMAIVWIKLYLFVSYHSFTNGIAHYSYTLILTNELNKASADDMH